MCVLAGVSLRDAAPGSGAVHSADAWAEREMEGMEASALSNAGLGKMTVFIVIPSSPTKLRFFFKVI